MANEIRVTARLQATKGNLTMDRNVQSLARDMTGTALSVNVQNIATTAEGDALVTAAGVATAKWAFFRNLDGTNTVTIGPREGGGTYIPVISLAPGDVALLPLATKTLYAKASASTVDLECQILEA
jgi:hypothetical protein